MTHPAPVTEGRPPRDRHEFTVVLRGAQAGRLDHWRAALAGPNGRERNKADIMRMAFDCFDTLMTQQTMFPGEYRFVGADGVVLDALLPRVPIPKETRETMTKERAAKNGRSRRSAERQERERMVQAAARPYGAGAMKTHFSLYGVDLERLDDLREYYGETQSTVLRIAIDCLHERVCRRGA